MLLMSDSNAKELHRHAPFMAYALSGAPRSHVDKTHFLSSAFSLQYTWLAPQGDHIPFTIESMFLGIKHLKLEWGTFCSRKKG